MDKSSIVDRAFKSVKWSAMTNILPRLITPLTTLLLAAILTPDDFGIVAATMIIITLAQNVVEFGMGAAIIQRRNYVREAASVAFWFSLVLALLLYMILWIISPWVADFYQIPEISNTLRVVGIGIILSALISIPNALLTREMAFGKLFWIGTAPQIVNAGTALIMAFLGYGYWAIIYGYLIGRLVNLILVWIANLWKPELSGFHEHFGSLIKFSLWIFFANIQTWLFLYADNSIAGYYLGANGLGVYSFGFNIANLIPGVISTSLAVVAYPAFSQLQNNKDAIIAGLLKMQTLVAAVVMPLCAGLSAMAMPVFGMFYGNRWQGLGFVITLLAIMPGVSHIWSLNAEAYKSIDRPDLWTKIAAATLIVMIPLLILVGPYGLEYFVITRFSCAFLLPVLNIYVVSKIFKNSVGQQLKPLGIPILGSLIMFTILVLISNLIEPFNGVIGWIKLITMIAIGASIYLIILIRFNKGLWWEIIRSAKRVVFPVKLEVN